jgi:hypothetical protein
MLSQPLQFSGSKRRPGPCTWIRNCSRSVHAGRRAAWTGNECSIRREGSVHRAGTGVIGSIKRSASTSARTAQCNRLLYRVSVRIVIRVCVQRSAFVYVLVLVPCSTYVQVLYELACSIGFLTNTNPGYTAGLCGLYESTGA